jgi:hypothetical protein
MERGSSAMSPVRVKSAQKVKTLRKLLSDELKGKEEAPSVIPRCAMRASRQPIRQDGQRGHPRRPLSPLSMAMVVANHHMPTMWEPIRASDGGSRRDRIAVTSLLVLSHQALLMEKTLQALVEGKKEG